ncbi:glycosyltransferase family 4 protein [Listeria kieliensis]|uniref:Glycosyl transferase n=1 Tax=Listeria kieliensis TaxID=1621700 RepID=A0A3D8TT85_9LIST|nr:glycosyltransferase family 4 protein [Listeria kieliensis]RDX02228.1 glycosyl transferase [Listeria kieliensis]
MNILMVGPDSNEKGGIATVIDNFKNYYVSREHRLYFLNSWSAVSKARREWKAIRSIRRVIREKQIDIVHFHVAQKGSFFRKALLKSLLPRRVKTIFHMHASQFDVFYEKSNWILRFRIRETLRKTDHIVVLGENWASYYRKLTKTPISVIPNAVHVPEKFSYDANSKTIVTFGRIGKRKGSYDILKVAKQIGLLFPEIQFVLYGDGEKEAIMTEIKQLNLANVFLGGWASKKDQEKILATSVLHFLPSYHEGLPMAILETMAAGIPNLSTNVGEIRDVIQDQENGMITDPGDILAMIAQLRAFLENRSVREDYSQKARKTIESNFSIEHYHEVWSKLYRTLKA